MSRRESLIDFKIRREAIIKKTKLLFIYDLLIPSAARHLNG